MAIGGSSSSNSSLSSLNNDNNNNEDDVNTQPSGQQGNLSTYTVCYRYPSGSAVKDELQNFQFDHEPTISDVKAKIKSMNWGIDLSRVDVYHIAFGTNNRNRNDNLI